MNEEAQRAGHPNIPEHKKVPAAKYHDKRAKIKAIFGPGAEAFVDSNPMSGLFGSIDVIALDDWFHEKFGNYDADDKTSMADFVTAKWGADVCKWLEDNMNSVM